MRKIAGLVLLALMIPVFASASGPSATAQAPTSVQLVRPISIRKAQDLWFGNLIVEANSGEQRIVQNASDGGGTRQQDPPGIHQLARSSGLWHNAKFEVGGEPEASFSVSLPDHSINIQSGATSMKVRLNYYSSGHLIDPQGNTIWVGGKLDLPNNPEPGRYSGNFEVTVAYH